MTQGNQVKLMAWYDNEWAYASRVYDFAVCESGRQTGGEAQDTVGSNRGLPEDTPNSHSGNLRPNNNRNTIAIAF